MDTVFLLYVGKCEDRRVGEVFATRAAAQAWIGNRHLPLHDLEIVEVKVVS